MAQEVFLRAFEDFGPGVLEFLFQAFLRGQQQALLFIEVRRIGAQGGQFTRQSVAALAHSGEFVLHRIDPLRPLARCRQIADRGLEEALGIRRCGRRAPGRGPR